MSTPITYDRLDRPYNNLLERDVQDISDVSSKTSGANVQSVNAQDAISGGVSGGTSGGSVETMPVKSGGSLGDIWIKNFIRSENWKPKTVGFNIDGQTGYAEFTNVYVSGEIEALSGLIGGFTIGDTDLSVTAGGNTTILSSGSTAFSAGPTGAPTVTITQGGVLNASGANITGAIIANSGSIGSFTIGTYLYTGSKTAYNDSNAGVHLGSDGIGIGNNVFTVSAAGALVAKSATIGNWTVNTTSIYTGTEDHSGYTANAGDITIYSDGSDASIHAKNFYIDSAGVFYATGAVIDGTSTIGGRLSSVLASAINTSGNFIDTNINTYTKTILGDFTFGTSGAIQIGSYVNGVTGDIKISPTGILGRDNTGATTFSIDATTGVAVLNGLVVGTNVGIGTAQTAGQVTTIIGNTVTTGYVNALNITAQYVAASISITSPTISGGTIQTSTSGLRILLDGSTDQLQWKYDGNLYGAMKIVSYAQGYTILLETDAGDLEGQLGIQTGTVDGSFLFYNSDGIWVDSLGVTISPKLKIPVGTNLY